VLSVHGTAAEAQHRRPVRQVVVHREEKVAQQRAVDAVVPRAPAPTCRTSRPRPAHGQGAARRASHTLWRMSSRRGSCAGTHRRVGGRHSEETAC
jgi:hypothetical protein